MSICPMEEIAQAATGPTWYQLYVWRDREIVQMLVERAKAAGYRALVVTLDTPVLGQRERDVRSGLVLPPRITAANVLDTLRRFSWLWDFLTHPRPTFGNFVGMPGVEHDAVSLAAFTAKQFSASIGWADVDWYRSIWPGPIALKGIMSAEDAREAAERGIEAVIVVAVFAVVVLGIGHVPTSEQTILLAFSMLAAAVTALLFLPVRNRLLTLVRRDRGSPGEVLRQLRQPTDARDPARGAAASARRVAARRTLRLPLRRVWRAPGGLLERAASDPAPGRGDA